MYQKVILIGNLGRDPELRFTPQGKAVCNFSVATSEKWGDNEETVWWNISVWGNQAESCNQYLTKGRQVMIEGKIKPDRETGGPRVWTDSDGNARAGYDLTALTVKFLGGKGGGGQQVEQIHDPDPVTNEEIPF